MHDFSNCPYCGYQLYGNLESTSCPSCSRLLPSPTASAEAIQGLSASLHAQAGVAADMLGALVSAQALPLISLLESWWNKLNEADKKQFAKSLMVRCLKLIESGFIDDRLRPVAEAAIGRREDAESLLKNVDANIEGPLSEALAKLIADEMGTHRASEKVRQGIREALAVVAKEHMMDQREVVEAAVRDQLPTIEEMTKRVVEEVTNDTAKEVRSRLRRNDD